MLKHPFDFVLAVGAALTFFKSVKTQRIVAIGSHRGEVFQIDRDIKMVENFKVLVR